MAKALIGHTGFVGGNLARQHHFDEFFNSKNIEDIVGRRFDLLVCSGNPAAKWIANREPEQDLANIQRLLGCLQRAQVDRFILISTVDVYPEAIGVDEDTPIDPAREHSPYGKHRLMLEQAVRAHFPSVLALRLTHLFGTGLKKNVVYDFMHQNEVHKIHADSVFQFYCLDHLWDDIERAAALGLDVVNFATEPVTARELAAEVFGLEFDNSPSGVSPGRYDLRTKHAAAFGGRDGYIYLRDQVMQDLRDFVARERAGKP
ncbi:MAG: NAD-dependent epimerase/dehydratase family protein [Isosphaeraceae bacterium]